MNYFKIILFSCITFLLFSCSSEDDICTSGEATPRLKMKFKNKNTGKLKTLDSLYIMVDYGNGNFGTLTKGKTDSVLVPIRIDDSGFTEIYFKTTKLGPQSKFRLTYQTRNQFVSPACGVKKLYENLQYNLLISNPILDLEPSENQIINENKTQLYLLF